jgi:hypothetical protein
MWSLIMSSFSLCDRNEQVSNRCFQVSTCSQCIIFGFCYHSVNFVSSTFHKRDYIKRHPPTPWKIKLSWEMCTYAMCCTLHLFCYFDDYININYSIARLPKKYLGKLCLVIQYFMKICFLFTFFREKSSIPKIKGQWKLLNRIYLSIKQAIICIGMG